MLLLKSAVKSYLFQPTFTEMQTCPLLCSDHLHIPAAYLECSGRATCEVTDEPLNTYIPNFFIASASLGGICMEEMAHAFAVSAFATVSPVADAKDLM